MNKLEFKFQIFKALLVSKAKEQLLFAPGNIFLVLVASTSSFLIFQLIFGTSLKSTNSFNFALHFISGMVILNFFVSVVTKSISAITLQKDLAINTGVPIYMFLISELTLNCLYSCIEVLFFITLIFFVQPPDIMRIIWLPVFMIFLSVFSISCGAILAICYSLYHKVANIWYTISGLLFFVTPIFYTTEILTYWRFIIINWINPLTGFLELFRCILISNSEILTLQIGQVLFSTFIFSLLAYLFYKKLSPELLERI